MASHRHILLINGPNLNLLGTREPQIYGSTTLHDIEQAAQTQASSLGLRLTTFQSNHEGAIIDRIHQAAGFSPSPPPGAATTTEAGPGVGEEKVLAIIINPGAYTHTSVGIRDALLVT
ncbi:Catabolic 3-dehydroquinase [Neurospora sp. IMI 360204]|nr:Catabolic 3-dehydroquinase [Neurospora sp. IMI 360204]